jgi:hypothetical protein
VCPKGSVMANDNLISSDNLTVEAENFELRNKRVITTHGELKVLVRKVQQDSGKSNGAINNAKTAYNGFLKSRALKDESEVDGLFDDNNQFEGYLKEYDIYLKGKSVKTRESYISHVRDYQKIYKRLAIEKLPDTFHEALLSLIISAGYTIHRFWKLKVEHILFKTTLNSWCTGKSTPSAKSVGVVKKLEQILNLEEGTLLNRLPKRLEGGGRRPSGLTSYGRKMQGALKNPYRVWTNRLEKQFEKLTDQMSSPTRPEGFERNSVWTSSDGSDIPKADIVQNFLRSFFGFCCLPKVEPDPYRNAVVKADERATAYMSGMGMDKEKMSLALLAVKKLSVTYLEFQRIRAGGVYTSGTTVFIAMVTSLLRPVTGYLYQHPEFAVHLEGIVENDGLSWHERCIDTRDRLLTIHKDLVDGNRIEYGRDPMEPIQDILDLERPLSVIFLMLEAIKKDMPPPQASILRRAEHFRNFLLLLLLTANPLRIRMYSIMRIGKHLIKEADGSWWFNFSRNDFKNRNVKKRRGGNQKTSRKSNRGGIYKVQLPPEVWPHIEEYLEKYRPHLLGAKSRSFLFLPVNDNHLKRKKNLPKKKIKKQTIARGLSKESLSRVVVNMTYFYIPLEGNPGFGPHAFRHIIATDIIKKDPSVGFFLAAIALNDELDTVEEEYVHLKTSEFFKPVSEHFSRRMHESRLLAAKI